MFLKIRANALRTFGLVRGRWAPCLFLKIHEHQKLMLVFEDSETGSHEGLVAQGAPAGVAAVPDS